MRIPIFPALIVLTLLAIVATACAVPSGGQLGPSLAPKLTEVATANATPVVVSSDSSCAKLVCSKSKEGGAEETGGVQSAFAQPAAEAAIALPQETRTDSEGSVTVAVTPAGGAPGTLIFDVSMNTHSVELNYDMTKIARLRDDQGRTYAVKAWNGPSGGHHRQGTLTFEAPVGPSPKSLELTLSGISDVPSRVFKWDVQQGGQG